MQTKQCLLFPYLALLVVGWISSVQPEANGFIAFNIRFEMHRAQMKSSTCEVQGSKYGMTRLPTHERKAELPCRAQLGLASQPVGSEPAGIMQGQPLLLSGEGKPRNWAGSSSVSQLAALASSLAEVQRKAPLFSHCSQLWDISQRYVSKLDISTHDLRQ